MPGYELIGKEEKDAVDEVFDKGGVLSRYAFDDKRQHIFRVDDLEKEIAKKLGAKYCLCVSSGTAALKVALVALGLKPGDEFITQSHTFVGTVEAGLELGAKPVICEVDETLNMDPLDLEKRITPKTKVIIPVHILGVPAKMDEIMVIARKHNIRVLEDSAQAFGATYKGKHLGTIGDAGIFSFDIGKILTTGEGGAMVTDKEEIYLEAREYSDHGHEQNPNFPKGLDTRHSWGFNYKMTELQGAVGLAQLKKMDYIMEKQRENKKKIKERLSGIQNIKFREIPDLAGEAGDSLIFFLESEEKVNKFVEALKKEGFGTKNIPDANPWHIADTWSHMFYQFEEYKGKDLKTLWPKSAVIIRKAVALPILINMDEEKINKLVDTVTRILKEI